MNEPRPHPRGDLGVTRRWLAGRPARGALVVALLGGAGVASVSGLLRWSAAPLRWSFAGLCLVAVVAVVWATVSRRDPG